MSIGPSQPIGGVGFGKLSAATIYDPSRVLPRNIPPENTSAQRVQAMLTKALQESRSKTLTREVIETVFKHHEQEYRALQHAFMETHHVQERIALQHQIKQHIEDLGHLKALLWKKI